MLLEDFMDTAKKTQPVNVISISGGKDSTAMLLLAIERQEPNLLAVFADTGNESPFTYEYLQYLQGAIDVPFFFVKRTFDEELAHKREIVETKWRQDGVDEERIAEALAVLKPSGVPFVDLAMVKGRFPSTLGRFCTKELKAEAIKMHVYFPLLARGFDVVSWQGIRRDESAHRANAKEREFSMRDESNYAELWNYRPILDWKAEDCFAMMKKHGIEPNPLYKMGFGRVGCMPCINCRKRELAEIALRFPEVIRKVSDWEDRVSKTSKRGKTTFFPYDDIHERVVWSRTKNGGRRFEMDLDRLSACKSEYGLCE